MKREHAYKIRDMMHKAVISLTDEDALEAVELFPVWKSGTEYQINERIRYRDKLYRVVQAHTSQEDWTPDITPALYTEVAEPGTIPVWKQPTGAQDAYMKGDKVHYPEKDDPVYQSTMDYNTYAPNVYGWEAVE